MTLYYNESCRLNYDCSKSRVFAFRYSVCREYADRARKYNVGVSSAILRNPKEEVFKT
jgi:hypothetical protein